MKGSTSLADIVGWAGGVDSAAEAKRILIEKNVDNNYQTVADITAESETLSSRLAGIPVKATDILRVFAPGAVPVQIQIQNEYVRVSGEVKQSGVFQLKKGETLRELVTRLGGATDNGYIYAMTLNRESVRRLQQAKLDEAADRFERDLAWARYAHDELLAALDRLPDRDFAGPSLLPGWTRAHVAAHLAHNAEGLGRLATWAATGVETPMYPSAAARAGWSWPPPSGWCASRCRHTGTACWCIRRRCWRRAGHGRCCRWTMR